MDTPEARQRARSKILPSLDGLSPPTPSELLSLDVFDTVMTRACGRPSDLFLWLGRRLATEGKITCAPEVFAEARARAEQAVWRRNGGLDSRSGPTDFYIEVTVRLHLDKALVPEFVEAELSLEAEVLRAVPAALQLLNRCEKAGTPVAFVSDTYFPANFIEAKLRDLDILRPGFRCLISSEEAKSKGSGQLFGTLTAQGHSPGTILHVGDHPHSDVAAPEHRGIRARWCVEGRLNRYEDLLSSAAPATAGFASALAGASRMARLTTQAKTPEEAAIRDVAAGVAGPVLIGYVLWILKRAQELGLERLVFLARDGQVLADMARRLVERLGLSIEIRYLYVSRQSTNLASTFEADDEETGWVFRDIPQLSATKFLRRFDLDWVDVSGLLGVPEPSPSAQMPAAEISEAFRKGLASGPLRDLVLERAAARRASVLGYLNQEGLLDDTPQAIVDFGGVGSQMRAIHALVKNAGARPPHIFLIGLDKPLFVPEPEPDWALATETYLYDHRRNRGIKRSRGFGTCVQMFCAADHGTVTGYSERDGTVSPDLAEEIDQRIIDWGLGSFRAALDNFVDHLVLDEELVDVYADIRDVTCDAITAFWTAPEHAEAAAWGPFPFEGAQASGSDPRPLAYPYTIRTINGEILSGRFPNLGWQHWYEGSLAISTPFIRCMVRTAEATYKRSEGRKGFLYSVLARGIRKLAGR